MYNWIKIKEDTNWIVEYSPNTSEYRVSYFEDYHYKEEVIFHEVKEA